MNIQKQTAHMAKNPKVITIGLLILSLAVYLAGLQLPLILVTVVAMAVFLPMPKVINSWLSRLVLSIFFLYSLLQIAAVLQFLIHPDGKFKLIAAFLTLEVSLLVALFGKASQFKKYKLLIAKDVCALAACAIFLLPFAPILTGNHSVARIAKIGSTQIVDGIAHFGAITDFALTQGLGYKNGSYYPLGFHISTAFIQNATFGNLRELSWSTHVLIYFYDYIFLGLLLCFVLIYLGYALLELALKKPPTKTSYLTLALSIGAAVTLTDLLLFVNEGFLNYYYICAAIFAGLLYVVDIVNVDGLKAVYSRKLDDKWAITAFLLITVGVSLSWPLLIAPIAIAILLWILPTNLDELKKFFGSTVIAANIAILIAGMFHILALYFQLHYANKGQYGINANGAIHTFNLPLIIIGIFVFALILSLEKLNFALRKSVVIATIPYIILVTGLMAVQYLTVGEARYYLIKSAEPLEMLTIVLGTFLLVFTFTVNKTAEILKFIYVPCIVVFLVIATNGMLPQPFREVRELFRDYSGMGKPAFLDNDTRLTAKLGMQGGISSFNATTLHYDASGDRLYAHIEIALWANGMAQLADTQGAGTCFGKQFSLIAYTPTSAQQQQDLITAVKQCTQSAKLMGSKYYVVTDKDSVAKLNSLFGNTVTLVY